MSQRNSVPPTDKVKVSHEETAWYAVPAIDGQDLVQHPREQEIRNLIKLAPPSLDPLQRYSIPETNALLRQSNARTYQQIKAGELRVIRDGGRTYIPGSEIMRRSTLPATDTATG